MRKFLNYVAQFCSFCSILLIFFKCCSVCSKCLFIFVHVNQIIAQFPTLLNFSSFHLLNMEMKLHFTHFMWFWLKKDIFLFALFFMSLAARPAILNFSSKIRKITTRSHAEMSFVWSEIINLSSTEWCNIFIKSAFCVN